VDAEHRVRGDPRLDVLGTGARLLAKQLAERVGEAGEDRPEQGVFSRLAESCVVYVVCPCVYPRDMAERNRRINVTLEPEYAQKLASLAERTHVQEGTLARSLLSSALDEADPDASRITEILDGIPGAWERAQGSIEQARRGETVPLSEL